MDGEELRTMLQVAAEHRDKREAETQVRNHAEMIFSDAVQGFCDHDEIKPLLIDGIAAKAIQLAELFDRRWKRSHGEGS